MDLPEGYEVIVPWLDPAERGYAADALQAAGFTVEMVGSSGGKTTPLSGPYALLQIAVPGDQAHDATTLIESIRQPPPPFEAPSALSLDLPVLIFGLCLVVGAAIMTARALNEPNEGLWFYVAILAAIGSVLLGVTTARILAARRLRTRSRLVS